MIYPVMFDLVIVKEYFIRPFVIESETRKKLDKQYRVLPKLFFIFIYISMGNLLEKWL